MTTRGEAGGGGRLTGGGTAAGTRVIVSDRRPESGGGVGGRTARGGGVAVSVAKGGGGAGGAGCEAIGCPVVSPSPRIHAAPAAPTITNASSAMGTSPMWRRSVGEIGRASCRERV